MKNYLKKSIFKIYLQRNISDYVRKVNNAKLRSHVITCLFRNPNFKL